MSQTFYHWATQDPTLSKREIIVLATFVCKCLQFGYIQSFSFNWQRWKDAAQYRFKIWLLVQPITRRQILDSSKLKEFADDNFKFAKIGRKLSKQVENTVGKGEIARYEQFLLFPQCFQKTEASKGVIVWEQVNPFPNIPFWDRPKFKEAAFFVGVSLGKTLQSLA